MGHGFSHAIQKSTLATGRRKPQGCVGAADPKEKMTNAPGVDLEKSTIRKIRMRLLPYLLILYVVNVLDRVNIGFAALTMNKELAITAQQFGFLAGVFFLGYFLFEVPSNLLLHKLGARVWIARILVSWGLVSGLAGFAHSATHIYIVRFLLGIAEAGFFPGMILYMTYWFRQKERAQAVAFFMMALPVASIIGAPVSGLILDHIHWLGISSWRWLLVLEALPAFIFGVTTYLLLPNRPSEANFLTQQEKDWLGSELAQEEKSATQRGHVSALEAMKMGRVWHMGLIYLTLSNGLWSMSFWLPQVVKAMSQQFTNTTIGLLVTLPHICGVILMRINSWHSDRTQERRFHAALPVLVGGCALLVASKSNSPALTIAMFALMASGIYSFYGPFWSLPSKFLTGYAAASGIAMINSIGQLGGFIGPYFLMGYVSKWVGSTKGALAGVGISLLLCGSLVLMLKVKTQAMAKHGSAPQANRMSG